MSSFATVIMLHALRARHKMRRCARVAGQLFTAPAVRALVVPLAEADALDSTACSRACIALLRAGTHRRSWCDSDPLTRGGACFRSIACSAALLHVLCSSGIGLRDSARSVTPIALHDLRLSPAMAGHTETLLCCASRSDDVTCNGIRASGTYQRCALRRQSIRGNAMCAAPHRVMRTADACWSSGAALMLAKCVLGDNDRDTRSQRRIVRRACRCARTLRRAAWRGTARRASTHYSSRSDAHAQHTYASHDALLITQRIFTARFFHACVMAWCRDAHRRAAVSCAPPGGNCVSCLDPSEGRVRLAAKTPRAHPTLGMTAANRIVFQQVSRDAGMPVPAGEVCIDRDERRNASRHRRDGRAVVLCSAVATRDAGAQDLKRYIWHALRRCRRRPYKLATARHARRTAFLSRCQWRTTANDV